MSVKHIADDKGFALCGIKVRSGSDRYDDNNNIVYRGTVNRVEVVEVRSDVELGMGGVKCLRCVKKYQKLKGL